MTGKERERAELKEKISLKERKDLARALGGEERLYFPHPAGQSQK